MSELPAVVEKPERVTFINTLGAIWSTLVNDLEDLQEDYSPTENDVPENNALILFTNQSLFPLFADSRCNSFFDSAFSNNEKEPLSKISSILSLDESVLLFNNKSLLAMSLPNDCNEYPQEIAYFNILDIVRKELLNLEYSL